MKKVSCHKELFKGLKHGLDRVQVNPDPDNDSFDLVGVVILVTMIAVFFLFLTIFGG